MPRVGLRRGEFWVRIRVRTIAIVLAAAVALCAAMLALSPAAREFAAGIVAGYRTDFAYLPVQADLRVTIQGAVELAADYVPGPPGATLVVLVHGSAPSGRHSALMRLLADGLVERGYGVLSLDLRGYGESQDPVLPLTDTPGFEQDVVSAAREALARRWAAPGALAYVGHSLGAAAVLDAAIFDPKPVAVVAIGYPDRPLEGLTGPAQRNFARKLLLDMAIDPDDASVEGMRAYLSGLDASRRTRNNGLPPILFVYGEKEPSAERQEPIAPERSKHAVRRISRAPHAYHASQGPLGIVVYNRRMLDALVDSIDAWCRSARRRS